MDTKEYYNAKEAIEILKKPSTTFYREVREGKIPHKGKRPNMQFPKDAIEAIAEIEAEREKEGLKFVESSIADAWTKQEIVKELFANGNEPYDASDFLPFKTILEWRKKNNNIGMHVEENGKILGWVTFLPLEEKIIQAMIRGEISEKDIPASSVKKWTDKNISVCVTIIEVVPTKDKDRDKRIGAFLIRNATRWAISLMIQYDIKNWYGFASSNEGEKLMQDLNFSKINSQDEHKWYVMQSNAKQAKVISETLKHIEAAAEQQV